MTIEVGVSGGHHHVVDHSRGAGSSTSGSTTHVKERSEEMLFVKMFELFVRRDMNSLPRLKASGTVIESLENALIDSSEERGLDTLETFRTLRVEIRSPTNSSDNRKKREHNLFHEGREVRSSAARSEPSSEFSQIVVTGGILLRRGLMRVAESE